eukprot:TRINITY_DN3327_c0_g1_i3.p1 TRINITY_DN3327_c0_g1~~TRINITY_DN3327_c0_g1_i3.p1  ORF type:complete len:144 (-),score=20.25 TRINITY_DN3327_c0_g1_i3:51-482(-)
MKANLSALQEQLSSDAQAVQARQLNAPPSTAVPAAQEEAYRRLFHRGDNPHTAALNRSVSQPRGSALAIRGPSPVRPQREFSAIERFEYYRSLSPSRKDNRREVEAKWRNAGSRACLLYTSDAADEEDSVDLGGCRIIQKKNS